MALQTNGTMNTTASPFGSAVDTSLQTDAQDAGDLAERDRVKALQTQSLATDQAKLANPASPGGAPQALPLATTPDASTQPVAPKTPSATPSAGQGGEATAPLNATTPAPLSTPDPLAFAPATASASGAVGGLNQSVGGAPTSPTSPTSPPPVPPSVPSAATNPADGYYNRDPVSNAVSAVTPEQYQQDTAQSLYNGVGTTFRGTDSGNSGDVYDPTYDRWYDPSTIPPGMTADQFFAGTAGDSTTTPGATGAGNPVPWAATVNAELAGSPAAPTAAAPTDPTTLPAGWETPIGFGSGGSGGATAGQGLNESAPQAPVSSTPTAGQGINESNPTNQPAPVVTTPPPTIPTALPLASGGSTPSVTSTPATPATPATPTPVSTSASGTPYANLTPTSPSTSLIGQTITPGQSTDRVALAQELSDLFDQQQKPYFTRDLRTATQNAAGRGQLGSGMLNSSLGDVTNRYADNQRIADQQFKNAAETGSIDDAYKNIGILQQQQQFQQGQSDTAFNQNVQVQQLYNSTQGQQFAEQMQAMGFNAQQIQQAFTNAFQTQQLSDSENQQSFWQALQQEIQGNANDPASIIAWLSGQYATNNPIHTAA